MLMRCGKMMGATAAGCHHRRQSLRKNTLGIGGLITKKAARAKDDLDGHSREGRSAMDRVSGYGHAETARGTGSMKRLERSCGARGSWLDRSRQGQRRNNAAMPRREEATWETPS